MMQLAERQQTKLTVFLPICLSDYLCRLTFHTEFGAPAVFVDENKKDKEEDASKAGQTHSDGNLRKRRCRIRLRQRSEDCVHIIILSTFLLTLNNPLDCDYCFLKD